MTPVDSASLEQLHHSKPLCADVWFLSGAAQPGDSIRHLPIDDNPYVVGRKSGVSLKINFSTVSGRHAELWVEDGQLHLKDLNSTNGTYVNGNRISDEVIIREEDLIHFAEAPFRVRRQSPISQSAGTIAKNVCDEALALVQFDRMMSERLVRPHFQPIVDLHSQESVGYEILGRGSVFGLESVQAMFHAAEQLSLEVELSQLLRWEGIRVGRDLPDRPTLFVNTHPAELAEPGLDIPIEQRGQTCRACRSSSRLCQIRHLADSLNRHRRAESTPDAAIPGRHGSGTRYPCSSGRY